MVTPQGRDQKKLAKPKWSTDDFSSAVWSVFGIVVILLSKKLGIGGVHSPGPGFITFWAGVILCGLAVFIFVTSRIGSRKSSSKYVIELWTGVAWTKAFLIVLSLVGYALTVNYFGYLICTIVLIVFLLKTIDPVKWIVAIGTGVTSSFVSFVVFDLWLKVQLPHGMLENFLAKV